MRRSFGPICLFFSEHRGWRGLALTLLALVFTGSSIAGTYGQGAHLSTYCAADATASAFPSESQWHPTPESTVVVSLSKPCWVLVGTSTISEMPEGSAALVLGESLALTIQMFDEHGNVVARAAPGLVPQNAIYAGRLLLIEPISAGKVPVYLYITLDRLATDSSEIETDVQWTSVYATLPQSMFTMLTSSLAAGGLIFVIFLSCALALALRRPLLALGGCASLINVQVLLGDSGSYTVLKLPASIFTYQTPLLYACFGMLLLFITEFCNFRQHCRKTAYALMAITSFFFGAALWLMVMPDTFNGFGVYEWLRLPSYLLLLYGLMRGVRLRHIPSIMSLAALVPDYVYLYFYSVPYLHWLMGDTVGVKLPEFAQEGSFFERFVILWLPSMLCMALIHRVLTVERERAKAALTDSLTGLPNRTGLRIALRHFSGDFTMVVLDLNRFKSIDLALGRVLGDEVLQGFAARLKCLPQASIARLHSDRFAVVLPGHFQPEDLIAKVEDLLSEPLQVQGQVVDLSATLGVSGGASISQLEQHLRQAEVALHHAHQRHLAALNYDSSLEKPTRNDLSLMSDLHQAVAKQELRLFLQPKVLLRDGSVSAAEGLVRWQHPQRGMVPPNEFVNFAEQIGRIGLITQWVLRQAMEITAQQRHEGKPLQVSVNISAVDLASPGFTDLVTQLAKQTGAEPRDIKLEITESAAMEDPEQAMAAMQHLHDLGFKWSLDDFGTGYSSLSYLQKMPLSELKIDRAFVRNVTPESDAAKLLGSVIALGHQLGLTVVAEGAETQAEWDLLKVLGADMVQGWFAAKAMPLQDFLQWCTDHPQFGL